MWIALLIGSTLVASATSSRANPAQISGDAISTDVLVPQTVARWPGKIFVNHDQWPLSDSAFALAPDTSRFASNLARWFTGGRPGKFLGYGCPMCFGARLAAVMEADGHVWTNGTVADFTLATLLQYDGVFLAGLAVDTTVLVDYVHAGGNIYVAGGTGAHDAAEWNTFLSVFGLSFDATYNGLSGVIPIVSTSPIFTGVGGLFQSNGSSIQRVGATGADTQILIVYEGQGLYAAYASGAMPVSVNVKPRECPNTINPRSDGMLRIAIAGSSSLDVRTIDPQSVRVLGVGPLRSSRADVTQPTAPFLGSTNPLDCSRRGPDGEPDLVLEFDQAAVVRAIQSALGRTLIEGDVVALTLTGNLKPASGGTPIVGEDLVVVIRRAATRELFRR